MRILDFTPEMGEKYRVTGDQYERAARFWEAMDGAEGHICGFMGARWALLPYAYLFDVYRAWLNYGEKHPLSAGNGARPLGRNEFIRAVRAIACETGKWRDEPPAPGEQSRLYRSAGRMRDGVPWKCELRRAEWRDCSRFKSRYRGLISASAPPRKYERAARREGRCLRPAGREGEALELSAAEPPTPWTYRR